MKFTVKEIPNTSYRLIDLEELFKDETKYPIQEALPFEWYRFQLLLEQDNELLFAIKNEHRAEIYLLNLDTFECEYQGELTIEAMSPISPLNLYALDIHYVSFEYELEHDMYVYGSYSVLDKKISFDFRAPGDSTYIHLTNRYLLSTKESMSYDKDLEQQFYNYNNSSVYLYDRIENIYHEITDERIKYTFHTYTTHYVYTEDKIEYFLNFKIVEDLESTRNIGYARKAEIILKAAKKISIIPFNLFVESIISKVPLVMEDIYCWDGQYFTEPYFHDYFQLKTTLFTVDDYQNKTLETFQIDLENKKLKSVVKINYRFLKNSLTVYYEGGQIMIEQREYETRILAPYKNIIHHTGMESILKYHTNEYLIGGWDDKQELIELQEYIKFIDSNENEKAFIKGTHQVLRCRKIVIKII